MGDYVHAACYPSPIGSQCHSRCRGNLVPETTLKRLRIVGLMEGTSYLLLLGIAMPLKYIADKPEMVENVGWIHGLLFIGYSLLVLQAWRSQALDLYWAMTALVAAVLPFGPFVLDTKLRQLSAQIERPEEG